MIYGDKKERAIVKYKEKEQESDHYSDDTIDFKNFILCNDVKYVDYEVFDDFINENYSDEKNLGTIKHSEIDEYECDNVQYDTYHISLFPKYDDINQSSNMYVYCENNTLSLIDPSGEVAVVDDAVLLLAAAAAAATYLAEHTKGARNSTWDKHSKKRSGAPSKAEGKPGWKSRSNKRHGN